MSTITRRQLLASGAAAGLTAGLSSASDARAQAALAPDPETTARQLLTGALTVDMHSHAGRFVRDNTVFEPVAEPMRTGGLAVACLEIVADSPTHRLFPDGRLHPTRALEPGELYAWSKATFARLLRLAQDQQLRIIGNTAQLRAAPTAGPSIIVTSEGADFIEDRIERVEEVRTAYGMRHLQLVH